MSKLYKILKSTILICFLGLLTIPAYGQKETINLDDWNFRISPFFWFIGFKGTIYRPPQPSLLPEPEDNSYDIDISFKEIAPHLKFAAMAAGEYRHNRFVTQFNLSSIIIDGAAVTPLDFVFQDVFLHLGYVSGDISVGHHFIMKEKFELAPIGGIKYFYFDLKGSTTLVGKVEFTGERDHLWLDPVIGLRLKYKPIRRIEIATYSDVGGFFFGNELNYQFIGTANYIVSKWFLVSLGYRIWGIKVDKANAIYNGRISGAIIRLGFQF